MPLLPRDALGKLGESMREYGLRETVERSSLWVAERLLGGTIRRHRRAPLSAFAQAASSMHFSAQDLLESYVVFRNGKASLSQLHSEYETLCGQIEERYRTQTLFYPQYYAVEQSSSFLLYALVRSLRPSVVLETGVANGHSSFFLLNAMRANDHGTLHSIDRSPEVGSLLASEERERWSLHVLQAKSLKRSFLQILNELPPIDLFLHDSDHTYPWQSFELRVALKKLAPGGILASDDCDGCNAFLDFCQGVGLRPVILVETRKVFGLVFTWPMDHYTTGVRDEAEAAQQPRLARA